MISAVTVVAGRYYDSVRLMQVSRDVRGAAGVEEVLVAMATDLNLRLLAQMGFDSSQAATAGPDDLVVALRADDEVALAAAKLAVERALRGPRARESEGLFAPPVPHTARAAGRAIGANIALISVPGSHAFVEAMEALRSGLHVMVFSNNVPLDQEVALKREAAQRNLLVMGPDCGTAIVGGAGLGFANAVGLGPVGITGASGTGIQQMCSLLDAAGVGVHHALGTGSNDLSSHVGGTSTIRALAALDADPSIEVIIVVSKPPDPDVGAKLEKAVAGCSTAVVLALVGMSDVTLEGAVRETLAVLRQPAPPPFPEWLPDHPTAARPGVLRGLFSGGTLRDEALAIAGPILGLAATEPAASGHRLVDYGSDEYTRGRAHPMIDATLRTEALAAAVADPVTSAVLFDIVLGYGAHPDPAGELAPIVRTAGIPVVVSLCGTRRDPQDLDRQARLLSDAGAEVYLSNAAAATRAAELTAEASA